MSSHHHDVTRFHLAMGLPVANEVTIISKKEFDDRVKFLKEELQELEDAAAELYDNPASPWPHQTSLGHIFDALIDLTYVAIGTAVQMGFPWQEGWDLVQDANMKKLPGEDDGKGHKLGIRKPEGWRPPDIAACLVDFQGRVANITGPLRCEHGIHATEPCPECAMNDLFVAVDVPASHLDTEITTLSGVVTGRFSAGVNLSGAPQTDALCPHGVPFNHPCGLCHLASIKGPTA